MKKAYSTPEVEFRKFDVNDIITVSGTATATDLAQVTPEELGTLQGTYTAANVGVIDKVVVKDASTWEQW